MSADTAADGNREKESAEVERQRLEWFAGSPGDWTDLRNRVTYVSRDQVLRMAVQLARPIAGHIIEFGVFKGHSIRTMRDELWRSAVWERGQRRKRIYACDSFEGLPENYEHLAAGTFATPVPVLRGIRIVKGFFDTSLTAALAEEVGQVSLAHLDADLHSSTRCALDWLTPLLHSGSILVFDEFAGEDPAEERALLEWTEATGIRVALLALFGREPSGKGDAADRRAIFQVIGTQEVRKAPSLLPERVRRKLFSRT